MADVITVCDSSSQCGILPYKDIDEVKLCKFCTGIGFAYSVPLLYKPHKSGDCHIFYG